MPRVKQFDEELVLKKAVTLFWHKGFNGTSVNDLVEHLGINRASLYDTFGDKQQLFEKAFQQYRALRIQHLAQYFSAQPSVKAGFEALFIRSIDEILEDPQAKGCFVVNITTELGAQDDKIKEVLRENEIAIERLFADFIQKGVESGEISAEKDVASLSTFLFVLYNGLNVVGKVNNRRETLIGTIQAALKIFD